MKVMSVNDVINFLRKLFWEGFLNHDLYLGKVKQNDDVMRDDDHYNVNTDNNAEEKSNCDNVGSHDLAGDKWWYLLKLTC